MALTQAQWLSKIKNWQPDWYVTEGSVLEAHLNALALVLSTVQTDMEGVQTETFIEDAINDTLDTHGGERTISRYEDELDALYRQRIRSFGANVSPASIETLVNALLPTGSECTVMENYTHGPWYQEMFFGTTGDTDFVFDQQRRYAWFSIFLPYLDYEETTGNVTVPAGEVRITARLKVKAGHTYTIQTSAQLHSYEIYLEAGATLNYGTIATVTNPFTGPGSPSAGAGYGKVYYVSKESFYQAITDTLEAQKAFGTSYDIYSEEFP